MEVLVGKLCEAPFECWTWRSANKISMRIPPPKKNRKLDIVWCKCYLWMSLGGVHQVVVPGCWSVFCIRTSRYSQYQGK